MRLFTILLLPAAVLSCIKYSAVYPLDETAPFQATISDNNLTTCWISRTYREHNRYQQLANLAPPTRAELQNPDTMTWGFKRWDFECLEGGYEAWANVGVRSVVYRRKREGSQKEGRLLGFVTDVREDIWGERWIYAKSVECDKKEEDRKKEEARKKEEEAKKKKKEEEAKKEDARVKEEKRKKEEEAKRKEEAKKVEEARKAVEQKKEEDGRMNAELGEKEEAEREKKQEGKRTEDAKKIEEAMNAEEQKRIDGERSN